MQDALSLTFHAAAPGIAYTAQTSTDLQLTKPRAIKGPKKAQSGFCIQARGSANPGISVHRIPNPKGDCVSEQAITLESSRMIFHADFRLDRLVHNPVGIEEIETW